MLHLKEDADLLVYLNLHGVLLDKFPATTPPLYFPLPCPKINMSHISSSGVSPVVCSLPQELQISVPFMRELQSGWEPRGT